MKKIIALFLAVIMMFSMTSVSYAADTTVGTETSSTTTIDNYMDYLETKLEGENFFVQLIARLVIIGVMLGFIKIEDFEAWFDNTAPDTDTEVDNDEPTADDNNTNTDWEDGAEVKLHHSQSLPFISNGATITDIKVVKEHYNNYYSNSYYLYKYTITTEATSDYEDFGALSFEGSSNSHTFFFSDNESYIYTNFDADTFFIVRVGM